MFVVLSIRLCQ